MGKERNGLGSDIIPSMEVSATDEEKRAAERVVRSMAKDDNDADMLLKALGLVVEPEPEPEPEPKPKPKREKEGRGRDYNVLKTHCPAGHEYNDENTTYNRLGHRRCRVCNREQVKAKYYKRKEQERREKTEAVAT